MRRWEISPFRDIDKRIMVEGPGPLRLAVDYDDVDHEQVARDTRALVERLNTAAKPTRLTLLEAIQKLLDDARVGLNKDHPISELVNYLDDPKNPVELDDQKTTVKVKSPMTESPNEQETIRYLRDYAEEQREHFSPPSQRLVTAAHIDHALDLVERAKTEREKIVALIKSRQEGWRHDNREIGQALEDLAWAIENGEHLKEGVGHGS